MAADTTLDGIVGTQRMSQGLIVEHGECVAM